MRWEALEALPRRGDWPQGATSDDTAQLLLVAEYLVEASGQISERDNLGRLAKALPGMRGAGPTTQAAVRRFVATGALHTVDGSRIGAAMRAAVRLGNPGRRDSVSPGADVRLSRTTHGAPEAIISACVELGTCCAQAIARSVRDLGIAVRAGIHSALGRTTSQPLSIA